MNTPGPTKVALLLTLTITATGLTVFERSVGHDAASARPAGWLLVLFAGLFLCRVLGQLAVLWRQPAWLPPMGQWHLMPYRLLLPIQISLLAVMVWIIRDLLAGSGIFAEPRPTFGIAVVVFSFIYAASMVVRYTVRMARRPEERWFGGTIPIVFHLVLASFLFVLGSYHASYHES